MTRTKCLSAVASMISMFSHQGVSQIVPTGSNSYDVPADPRSVAMGESFVALTGNQNSMMFNPAGLGAIRGAQVLYSLRELDWYDLLDDFIYRQVNATVGTPYVNLGISYNRQSTGVVAITTAQFPEGTGTARIFNHTFAVGFGKRFGPNWDLGMNLKMYDFGHEVLSGDVGELKTTPAYVVDLGCIYSAQIATDLQSATQSVSFGTAIQNLGTKLKTEVSVDSVQRALQDESLPQYVRVGFTYEFKVPGENGESLRPFSVLASGEWRTFLNASDFQSGSKDFWGFGLEMKLMEIVTVRLSGFVNAYSSVYGKKGDPALRYGFGVSLPLQRFGAGVPLTIQFDYAGIPPQISNEFIGSRQTKTMQVFSISVAYENEIF